MFPLAHASNWSNNYLNRIASSGTSALSPATMKCVLARLSRIYVTRPSTIVKVLPMVPAASSSSNSGISTVHVSDLYSSLARSAGLWAVSMTRRPFGDISPPPLISLLLAPQYSQVKAMMTTSLKCGTVTTHMFVIPSLRHA